MRILLYNPDNGVTQTFMPHLWMFLLQALTPPGHEVVLIDGNTQPISDAELVQFVLDERIGLVGIGAMTRMIAKAYRVADSIRAAGTLAVPDVPKPQGFDQGTDNLGMRTGLVEQRSVVALPREPMVPWSFLLLARSEIESSPASSNVVQNRLRDVLA